MNKPIAFNYRKYEELREAYKELLEEVEQLQKENSNLKIRLRIAEEDQKK